jgi:ligand-binding sensor domain-containing protein
MVCRRAFILFIVLLLTAVCTVACSGSTPTPTPHFTKWGDSIDAVAMAPDGTVWVSLSEHGEENLATSVSRGAGVARFDGQTWTTYTYTSGGALAGKLVSAIVVTPEGVVWFGTIDGAVRLAGETWTTYTARDGLVEGEVTAIAVAPDGAVWFGTWGGVSRFTSPATSTRGSWTTYTTEDGLPEDWAAEVAMIEGLAVAPDGVVWAGTDNDGVSRFDGQAWTTYT